MTEFWCALEEKETAKGGIIIPDTAKEKPHEGEVTPSEPASWKRASAFRST